MNALLIENAIRRCVTVIEAALLEADEFYDLDESEVAEKIALALRGSVANYAGVEYAGYYDANDGYMHFGVQAIHVDSFVSEVWDVLDLDLVNRPEDYDWFEQDDV